MRTCAMSVPKLQPRYANGQLFTLVQSPRKERSIHDPRVRSPDILGGKKKGVRKFRGNGTRQVVRRINIYGVTNNYSLVTECSFQEVFNCMETMDCLG